MGYAERMFADSGGLTQEDVAQLANDSPVPGLHQISGPISGMILRDRQASPYILDTANLLPESHRLLPEQMAIAALVLASFIGPIWHLLG